MFTERVINRAVLAAIGILTCTFKLRDARGEVVLSLRRSRTPRLVLLFEGIEIPEAT